MKVEQPAENQRIISLTSGNKIRADRKDPYGFWYISFEHGPTPKELQGTYTTIGLVLRAVETYVNGHGFEVGEPEPKAPPVKTKKVSKVAAERAAALAS